MTIDRRGIIKSALVAGLGLPIPPQPLVKINQQTGMANLTIHLHPTLGRDTNAGSIDAPIKSLAELTRRINAASGQGSITAILSEGVYIVDETVRLAPDNRRFTEDSRLTIRAAVLPDDPEWNIGRMPTLIHSLPLSPTWNGRPDPLGGAANGILVETSHVTIRGLKILGLPVIETPVPGRKQRLYGIARLRRDLDDLEVAQCLFISRFEVASLHVGIIAHGNRVNVHHCVFLGDIKDAVVYWTPGSRGHAMRNCLFRGMYSSTVWTSGIADDFDYRNNVVANANYVWIYQSSSSARADNNGRPTQPGTGLPVSPTPTERYQVIGGYFANNKAMTGTGTGARVEFSPIDSSFLNLTGTRITPQEVIFESDSTKRNYLHPVTGSDAASIGAGLFMKPFG